MKFKNYKTKSLKAVAGAFLLVIGLFAGYWATSSEMSKEISAIEIDKQATYDQMIEYVYELDETYKEIIRLRENLNIEQNNNQQMQEELNAANATISDMKNEEYELVYIGDFKITHYCIEKREHTCGTGTGLTATGTQVTAGRTVAVDPTVIPYGTKIYIEGYGWRIAEDTGGGVNGDHIDIAVTDHATAISMGTATGGVWILVEKDS